MEPLRWPIYDGIILPDPGETAFSPVQPNNESTHLDPNVPEFVPGVGGVILSDSESSSGKELPETPIISNPPATGM